MSEPENITALAAKAPWLRWLMHGLGGGTAIALGLASIKAVENRPEFLPQLLTGNGPLFVLFLFGMVIFDRRMEKNTELQTRYVAAEEQLAAGVQALVAKDDQKAREQEILLDHLAVQTGKILAHLEGQAGGHPS